MQHFKFISQPIVGCNQCFDRHWAGWSLNSLGTVREGELACILASSQYWNQDGPMCCNPKGVGYERSAATGGEWVGEGHAHTCQCTWWPSCGDPKVRELHKTMGEGGTLCSPPCTWQSTTYKRDYSFSTISGGVTSPTLLIITLIGIISYAESRNSNPSLLASIRLCVSSKWLFPVT